MEQAIEEWGKGLAGLTGEQIGAGLDRCRRETEWPPTIAQFRKLATEPAEGWQHRGEAYRIMDKSRLLPKPAPDMEKGRAAFGYMRKLLGMKPFEPDCGEESLNG